MLKYHSRNFCGCSWKMMIWEKERTCKVFHITRKPHSYQYPSHEFVVAEKGKTNSSCSSPFPLDNLLLNNDTKKLFFSNKTTFIPILSYNADIPIYHMIFSHKWLLHIDTLSCFRIIIKHFSFLFRYIVSGTFLIL